MRPTTRILVVDDDEGVAAVLTALLQQEGFVVQTANSGEEGLRLVRSESFDLVLSDVRMPGLDGIALLDRLRREEPDLPVVLVTAHGTVPLAVDAMKRGAADFVMKPFDRAELVYIVKKELQRRPSEVVSPALSSNVLLGDSSAMVGMLERLRRAAPTDATVLLLGESGTGKEQVANCLHRISRRSQRPFVKVNCGGLPDSLLESELFGYEKGAFTGASMRKPGRVELADGGTLFFDEIGDTSPSMQVKLLRLLQEREFERLGGTSTLKADLRFVAATHRNLEQMVRDGSFREDLFYRLNVVPLYLPPLRERSDDIQQLVQHFLTELTAAHQRPWLTLEPTALSRLVTERWPGNVRQLKNLLERLVVLASGTTILLSDVERELGPRAGGAQQPAGDYERGQSLDSHVRHAERRAMLEALQRSKGNRSLAARLLGVSRRTFYNKLAELEIDGQSG